MPDCLISLVGLSQDECDCFTTGRPEGYDDSDSGYYLTDADYGFPMLEVLDQSSDCDSATVWDILEASRDQAILQFRTDFLAKVRDRYNRRVKTWKGTMGKLTWKTTSAGLRTYAGIVLRPEMIRDGSVVLSGAWLGLTSTQGSVTLNISSNDPTFTAVTKTISSTANTFKQNTFAASVTLPMYSDKVDFLEYYIYYATSGLTPLNNAFYCCGGPGPYARHLRFGGFTVDTVDDENVSLGANSGFGLALDGYFACSELEWLCSLDEMAGYEVRSVIGRAIQSNGAAIAASEVIHSSRVNRYTTWDNERLVGKYNDLKLAYENYLTWLVENFPADASDCFECKSARNFSRRQLLV